MTEQLSRMKLNEEQLELVSGGYSKKESIKAIDDIIKKILGPVVWSLEYSFDKNVEGK